MRSKALQWFLIIILLSTLTVFASNHHAQLGLSSCILLYLLIVLISAYAASLVLSIFTAIASFCLINYFLVEPRYTFDIADNTTWFALIVFLIVSLVVSSLVQRLKWQTQRADKAKRRAEFSKRLSELLVTKHEVDDLLQASCKLLSTYLNQAIYVVWVREGVVLTLAQSSSQPLLVEEGALKWVVETGKTIGHGTHDWPQLDAWVLPFSRLPTDLPALVVADARGLSVEEDLPHVLSLVDQISSAYQRQVSLNFAQEAELLVREESIHSALIASLSHDMRTPLTTILGAATTLLNQHHQLETSVQQELMGSICSEAYYLRAATENVLFFARFDDKSASIQVDWQSPEEIVGVTLARYRMRNLVCRFETEVDDVKVLIKADSLLLTKALANLIDNAVAVHEGNEPIVLAVKLDSKYVGISVCDRGGGFPHGFEVCQIKKFLQLSPNPKGFGLGLAIVKAIVDIHKAELLIKPRDGGGSIVSLRFDAHQLDTGGADAR